MLKIVPAYSDFKLDNNVLQLCTTTLYRQYRIHKQIKGTFPSQFVENWMWKAIEWRENQAQHCNYIQENHLKYISQTEIKLHLKAKCTT